MGPLDFIFGLLLLGTVTGVTKMLASALAARGTGGAGPRLATDQMRALEMQLLDARLQNDQLQKQLDWHSKLLDTQERLIDRIGSTASRPAASAS